MSKIFRPRRGLKDTMVSNATVLAKGEMFFEVPDDGVGTGTCKVKMGDGSTAYSSLPYALSFDDSIVNFTESTSTDDDTLLAEIVSGASQATLFGSIKALLSSLVEQVTSLNNDRVIYESLHTALSYSTSLKTVSLSFTNSYSNIIMIYPFTNVGSPTSYDAYVRVNGYSTTAVSLEYHCLSNSTTHSTYCFVVGIG